jgi:FixJ family two-component response regulator
MHHPLLSNALSLMPFVVVDDDPRIRNALKDEFEDLGLVARFFDNAFELIDYVASEVVSGVFVDLLLPQMNGIECVKRLRLVGYKGSIFIFTGLCDPEMKKQAMDAGATDYIIKSDLFDSLSEITASCNSDQIN